MPRKIGKSKTVQFSITLPVEAVELMRKLARVGLYGTSRGEVARELILSQLRELARDSVSQALGTASTRKVRSVRK